MAIRGSILLEPQYANSGSSIAGCCTLTVCPGSEVSTNGFFAFIAYASRTVHFAQLSLTRQFRVGGYGGCWKFRSAPASPFLIDILEFFTKGMPGSSAK